MAKKQGWGHGGHFLPSSVTRMARYGHGWDVMTYGVTKKRGWGHEGKVRWSLDGPGCSIEKKG